MPSKGILILEKQTSSEESCRLQQVPLARGNPRSAWGNPVNNIDGLRRESSSNNSRNSVPSKGWTRAGIVDGAGQVNRQNGQKMGTDSAKLSWAAKAGSNTVQQLTADLTEDRMNHLPQYPSSTRDQKKHEDEGWTETSRRKKRNPSTTAPNSGAGSQRSLGLTKKENLPRGMLSVPANARKQKATENSLSVGKAVPKRDLDMFDLFDFSKFEQKVKKQEEKMKMKHEVAEQKASEARVAHTKAVLGERTRGRNTGGSSTKSFGRGGSRCLSGVVSSQAENKPKRNVADADRLTSAAWPGLRGSGLKMPSNVQYTTTQSSQQTNSGSNKKGGTTKGGKQAKDDIPGKRSKTAKNSKRAARIREEDQAAGRPVRAFADHLVSANMAPMKARSNKTKTEANASVKKSQKISKNTKLTKMKKLIVSEREKAWILNSIIQPLINKVVGEDTQTRKKRRKNNKTVDWQSFARQHHILQTGPVARDYCRQISRRSLDSKVTDLLATLMRFNQRLWEKDQAKAKTRKRFVCGLREVKKGVKGDTIRCVIVARNIEPVAAPGGLDSVLQEILDLCQEKKTPVVFSLTRKKLGIAVGKQKNKVSVVGLMDYSGADELVKSIRSETTEAKEEFQMWLNDTLLNPTGMKYYSQEEEGKTTDERELTPEEKRLQEEKLERDARKLRAAQMLRDAREKQKKSNFASAMDSADSAMIQSAEPGDNIPETTATATGEILKRSSVATCTNLTSPSSDDADRTVGVQKRSTLSAATPAFVPASLAASSPAFVPKATEYHLSQH